MSGPGFPFSYNFKNTEGLQNQASKMLKRAMVKVGRTREKGSMVFVEYVGGFQEDAMEVSMWRETLGRGLESHDTVEPIGRRCHGNCC